MAEQEKVRIYDIPADRHLSVEQIKGRIQDEIRLYQVHGDEVSLDLIRGHLRWMRRKLEAQAILALAIAYRGVYS